TSQRQPSIRTPNSQRPTPFSVIIFPVIRNFRFFLAASFAATGSLCAQTHPVTAADYARAEKFLAGGLNGLMVRAQVQPNWLPDGRMWYSVTTAQGNEFILVDPARGTREPAFDRTNLASALSKAAGSTYDAAHLPFQTIAFTDDGKISVAVDGK